MCSEQTKTAINIFLVQINMKMYQTPLESMKYFFSCGTLDKDGEVDHDNTMHGGGLGQ